MESKWNVCGLCGVYVESMWSLCGVYVDYCGIHVDSKWNVAQCKIQDYLVNRTNTIEFLSLQVFSGLKNSQEMHRHYHLKLTTTLSHNKCPGIYTYHENIMKQPESTTDG